LPENEFAAGKSHAPGVAFQRFEFRGGQSRKQIDTPKRNLIALGGLGVRMDQLVLGPFHGPVDVLEHATGSDGVKNTGFEKPGRNLAGFADGKHEALVFTCERGLNVNQYSGAGRVDVGHTPQVEDDRTQTRGRRTLDLLAEHLGTTEKQHALEFENQNVLAPRLEQRRLLQCPSLA
jgi:hypothetical protein